MIHLLLLAAMLAAFAFLCAADPRHQPHLFGARRPERESRRLRAVGWALVMGAVLVACAMLGIGYGLVEALGLASIGAVVQTTQLCRAMHRKAPAWPWFPAHPRASRPVRLRASAGGRRRSLAAASRRTG